MRRTNLPESLTVGDATLYPVIGGHLRNSPFLTLAHSGVDVTKNGWGNEILGSVNNLIVAEAKRRKLRYRRVEVLSRGLRGKRDLHGDTYRPTKWVFVEVKEN